MIANFINKGLQYYMLCIMKRDALTSGNQMTMMEVPIGADLEIATSGKS